MSTLPLSLGSSSKLFKDPFAAVAPKKKKRTNQNQQKPISKNILNPRILDVPGASSRTEAESSDHISPPLEHTLPATDHEAPRKITLVVKVSPGDTPGSIYGLANMLLTIHNFDEFEQHVEEIFGLYPEDYTGMYATTRPSLGPLSPLQPWDVVKQELNESSWEAVIGMAEIQGWLGVMIDCL